MSVSGFDLKAYLSDIRMAVDTALERHLGGPARRTRLYRAMYYSVMAGGKRLRPVLCVAAAQSVGGSIAQVIDAACALECIHTYSLIHDDLPAMDDDEMRRGSPTCHVQFDEATAILAGDALLTIAFQIITDAAGKVVDQAKKLHWLQVLSLVAAAAGPDGMIEGQMRDMACEGRVISALELETMHRLKTGRMIEVSVSTGAHIAGATADQQQALCDYAGNIGLAFQVADDILNVNGDPQKLGKATGTDSARGKNTYPALMGIDDAETYAQRLVNNALKALGTFDNRADPLRAIARYVIERKR